MAHTSPPRILFIALLFFSVLGGPAVASDPPQLGLYWTDASGAQSDRIAQHWMPRLTAALHRDPGSPTPIPGALGDMTALPNLAVASHSTASRLGIPWILILQVGPDDAPTIHAHLVNIEHRNWTYDCSGLHVTEDGWTALATFLHQALEEAAEDDHLAVTGLASTGTYHRTDATHVTGQGVAYSSPALARASGLHPCPLCFPASAGPGPDVSEIALSDDVARLMMAHHTLSEDKKSLERVGRVGRRLLDENHIHDFSYTFNILESPEVNAFSAGAGHVFITTRLLALLETDDELAAVLGHEIGHCECHHVLRAYRQHQTVSLVGVMLSMATGSSMGSFVSDFLGGLFTRGFGRSFELEADYRGLLYAHVAGFRAEAFVTALKKLEQSRGPGSAPPEWLSTHPSSDNRIDELRKEIADIAEYDAQVSALQSVDPPLAEELRAGMAQYLRQEDKVRAFLAARAALTGEGQPPPLP